MAKKVVGIAMGGYSSEREISIESGDTVFNNLMRSPWSCFKIIIDKKHRNVVDSKDNK